MFHFTSCTSFTLLNLIQLAHSLASKIEVSGQVFDLHVKQSGNQTSGIPRAVTWHRDAPSDPVEAKAKIMACWSWNATGDGAAEGFEINKIWQMISFYQLIIIYNPSCMNKTKL